MFRLNHGLSGSCGLGASAAISPANGVGFAEIYGPRHGRTSEYNAPTNWRGNSTSLW